MTRDDLSLYSPLLDGAGSGRGGDGKKGTGTGARSFRMRFVSQVRRVFPNFLCWVVKGLGFEH